MRQLLFVLSNQKKLFFHDMGMILFYLGGVVVFGFIFPLILQNNTPQFALAILMTATLQKQWASDSIAGERENQTLESLLSTPISSKYLLFGKALFNFICVLIYYMIMIICILLSWQMIGAANHKIQPISWVLFGLASLCSYLAASLFSVFVSAKSTSVREAGRKSTIMCYLNAFLLIVVSVLLMNQPMDKWEDTILTVFVYFIIICLMVLYFSIKILAISRPDIMMPKEVFIKIKKSRNDRIRKSSTSQIKTVFYHEWRYFCTLKGLIFMFGILTVSPAVFLALGNYYLSQNNIYFAIFITIVMIPRVPSNLIAYSVGGEKAYKTAESILSTPISIQALFIGKSAVPMVICMIMLILSSILTLVVTNMIAMGQGAENLIFFDALQSILLYGGGIMVSITMTLVTAILSLVAKSPRKGLYISTILGFAFIMPVLAITYFIPYKIAAALLYLGVLVIIDFIVYKKISGIGRSKIMTNYFSLL